MSILDKWEHRWFGVWYEYGPAYEECPHVRDFVFSEVTMLYDKKRIRNYLVNAHEIATTSRSRFPCPFTGKRIGGSISYRTDGCWLWLDDLADYIDQFDVAIPTKWLEELKKNDYIPPRVTQEEIDNLEWPPIKH